MSEQLLAIIHTMSMYIPTLGFALSLWTRSHVPTYDDIVGDSDGSEERVKEKVDERREEAVDVSEDEASLDRQEDFERSYNFRFEEPGGDQVSQYPLE